MAERDPAINKPRLAWFTPFAQRSAIGACSRRVVQTLAASYDVEVWHPDLGEPIETTVACRPFDPLEGVNPQCLEAYDHVLYNFGNNYEFHGGIFNTARQRPGVVVLHDAVMYHFFAELYLEDKKDPSSFLSLFDELYGPRAVERVSRSLRGLEPPLPDTQAISQWSLLEATVESALGVVVHSEYCKAKIADIVECPIAKAGLPVERASDLELLGRSRLGVPSDHVLIVIAGGLNRNKRADSVIRALGALRGRTQRTTLALVGWITTEESARLKEIARAEGVDGSLLFVGFASDEVFYSYLAQADICVNLRYPNTEGGSASVVEEMLYDNAVVALNTGVFGELPDNTVSRVRLAYEHQDLTRALGELIESPERREELATRARSYAERAHRTDLYARKVHEVLEATNVASPLLRLADQVSEVLSEIGCQRGSAPVEAVVRCMDETFLRESVPNSEASKG